MIIVICIQLLPIVYYKKYKNNKLIFACSGNKSLHTGISWISREGEEGEDPDAINRSIWTEV